MARDLKKEHEWAKAKYEVFKIQIDKEMGLEFRAYLKDSGVKLTDWFKEKINETLKPAASIQVPVPVKESYEQAYRELRKQIDDGLKEINNFSEKVKNKTQVPVEDTSTSIQVPVKTNEQTQVPVFLTYKEVAEMKGVKPEVVRNAVRRGKLKKTAGAKINYDDAMGWDGIG